MMKDSFVQIEELARYFAVSISTIRAWVRQGHIPKTTYIKVGSTYRFNKVAVTAALTSDVEEEVPNELPASDDNTQLEFDFNAGEHD
tara:strand:+ start:120 stop:380 length:261 start_codon:yes stop_codon:yes gene_type:complete